MIDMFVSKWAITSKSLNIIPWIKKKLFRAKIEIFAARTIQIGRVGNDLYGPTIELNLAFLSEHQDIVVRDLAIMLKHESGKEKIFEWRHLSQNVHSIETSPTDVKVCYKKYFVLIIKVNQVNIEERLITCQESETDPERLRIVTNAIKRLRYADEEANQEDYDYVVNSQEILELKNYIAESFSWDKGTYKVVVKINRCEPIDIIGGSYSFSLNKIDVKHLRATEGCILKGLEQLTFGLHGNKINWNTLSLPLQKIENQI